MSNSNTLNVYTYQTAKTETTELNVVTATGVLQIKIVESANGKKREVFAGFDPVQTFAAGFSVHDHKYFKASKKAVDKWAGSQEVTAYDGVTIDYLVENYDLRQHMEGRVLECVEQAFGFATATAKTPAQIDAEKKQAWAIAHQAYQERIANDPTYGIF